MDHSNANDGIRLFAQSAISAVIVINSGALIATLSQLSDLVKILEVKNLIDAIAAWSFGVALGALAWVAAALSATSFANNKRSAEIWIGAVGYFLVVASIGMFVFGAFQITDGFKLSSL